MSPFQHLKKKNLRMTFYDRSGVRMTVIQAGFVVI